jgi:hypothetical protein
VGQHRVGRAGGAHSIIYYYNYVRILHNCLIQVMIIEFEVTL